MGRIVVLDSGPVGLACVRPGVPDADRCRSWILDLQAAKIRVVLPAIVDYEVRRELIRLGSQGASKLQRLDALGSQLDFLPLTQDALRRAAEFWAQARRYGAPTAAPDALDGDVILAAQAEGAAGVGDVVTVATANALHLGRFVDAQPWAAIVP